MEKEKVLDIKIIKVNDKYSVWCIAHQNEEIINKDFYDKEIGVKVDNLPSFSEIIDNDVKKGRWLVLFNRKLNSLYKDLPCIINNATVNELIKKVNKINEKYGIPKRWKPERNKIYYVIDEFLEVLPRNNYDITFTKRNYIAGNCFETKEEAEVYAEKFRKMLVERKLNKNE